MPFTLAADSTSSSQKFGATLQLEKECRPWSLALMSSKIAEANISPLWPVEYCKGQSRPFRIVGQEVQGGLQREAIGIGSLWLADAYGYCQCVEDSEEPCLW